MLDWKSEIGNRGHNTSKAVPANSNGTAMRLLTGDNGRSLSLEQEDNGADAPSAR
jgi:hypothetical protein